MSLVAVEVSIPSDSFQVGSILQDHVDVLIDPTQFVPDGDSFLPYFWVETDDEESFEESVRADDRVASLVEVDTAGDRTLYKTEWAEEVNGFFAAVAEYDLHIEDATGTDERWTFHLRGPDRESLAAFRDAVLDDDIPLHVHRIWNPYPADGDEYGLTEIQRETVKRAYRGGYFDDPRGVSQTDLADELDVTRQSVSRRLRGGLKSLLSTTLMSGETLDQQREQ